MLRVPLERALSSASRRVGLDDQIVEFHHAIQNPNQREAIFIIRVNDNDPSLSVNTNVFDRPCRLFDW